MTDVELIISAENSKELKMQGVSLKGDPGEPGKTPQRGIDYWTPEDKAEVIKEATKAAVEGITPFVFDVTLSDDLTEIITETTYTDIEEAYDAGKQVYARVNWGGDVAFAPLHSKSGIHFIFELFIQNAHSYLDCYDDGYTQGWRIKVLDIVTQEEFNSNASYVFIKDLEDSKQIRVYAPNDVADDNGIFQAIELYDKEQMDAKLEEAIGDIDTDINYVLDETEYQFYFDSTDNTDTRLSTEMTAISFVFGSGVYPDAYMAGLSFDSGVTPTRIDYTDSGILNWVGTDCSDNNGYSIFKPESNKHYDIVFYFNGRQFIGLVNGFVPSLGNVVSE